MIVSTFKYIGSNFHNRIIDKIFTRIYFDQAVMHGFSEGSSTGKLQKKYYATEVCH